MSTRGAFLPPQGAQRPSDPLQAAVFDAKNAHKPAEQTIAAAKLNELVKEDALHGSGGGAMCLNIFKYLRGADAGVITAYRDLVIGDSSYAIKNTQYTAEFISQLADAAKGQANWPGGTNT